MKTIVLPALFLIGISVMLCTESIAQTLDIGPNQYAFRLTVNPNYGLYFNGSSQRYEFMSGSGTPVLGFDANNGDLTTNLRFASGSDYLVGNNSYAFRASANPNYGLFFNSSNLQYEFRNASAAPVLALDATNGRFRTDLRFDSGTSLRVAAGNWAIRSASAPAAGLFFGTEDIEFRSTSGDPILALDASSGEAHFANTISVPGGGNSSRWTDAYSWGDHAEAGYLDSESDPLFSTSPAAGISATDVINWAKAYNWGNHANAGYISTETDPKIGNLSNEAVPRWNNAAQQLENSSISASTISARITGAPSTIGFIGDPAIGTLLLLENPGTGGGISLQTSETSLAFSKQGNLRARIGTQGDDFFIRSSDKFHLRAGNSGDVLTVTQDDRIGIRRSSPSHTLHINSPEDEGALRVQVNGATRFLVSANEGVNVGTSVDHAPPRSLYVHNSLLVARTEPVPGYRMAVRGRVICEEVKVQLASNWPDYVFADDYPLMDIEDLAKYIQEEKHLPGMPSAAEVSANDGFELGDIQKKTLEKVEELTLYLLQQNELIQKQAQMIDTLRREMELMKKSKH